MKTSLAALSLIALVAACGDDTAAQTSTYVDDGGTLEVAVVNYPLAYFAERIGGEAVEVVFPAPAGVDPAFWRPSPEDVVRFQAADLILVNGAGYAGWTRTATLPASRRVDTLCGVPGGRVDRARASGHAQPRSRGRASPTPGGRP